MNFLKFILFFVFVIILLAIFVVKALPDLIPEKPSFLKARYSPSYQQYNYSSPSITSPEIFNRR